MNEIKIPPPITDTLLVVGDEKFIVLHAGQSQAQDSDGLQPYGKPYLEYFSIKVKSNLSPKLKEWQSDKIKKYSGSIQYFSNGTLISEDKFENAYCKRWKKEGDFTGQNGTNAITETVDLLPESTEWEKITFPKK